MAFKSISKVIGNQPKSFQTLWWVCFSTFDLLLQHHRRALQHMLYCVFIDIRLFIGDYSQYLYRNTLVSRHAWSHFCELAFVFMFIRSRQSDCILCFVNRFKRLKHWPWYRNLLERIIQMLCIRKRIGCLIRVHNECDVFIKWLFHVPLTLNPLHV